MLTEDDPCVWTRESAVEQSCSHGKIQPSRHGFKCRNCIGQQTCRTDPSVADSCERLRAEEESIGATLEQSCGSRSDEMFKPYDEIESGEENVDREE